MRMLEYVTYRLSKIPIILAVACGIYVVGLTDKASQSHNSIYLLKPAELKESTSYHATLAFKDDMVT